MTPSPLEPAESLELDQERRFASALAQAGTPLVTFTLIAINLAVFVAMVVRGVSITDPSIDALLNWGADFGPLVHQGEWWRIFTSMFLHIGIMHLLMNMYVLLIIGMLTERVFGHAGFLLLYVLAGIGGSFMSLTLHPGLVSAGASGAVFGLYGGLFGFLLMDRRFLAKRLIKSQVTTAGIFIAYNLVYGLKPGIDLSAHGGGLAAGFVFGAWLTLPLPAEPGQRLRRNTIVAICGAALALAMEPRLPVGGTDGMVSLGDGYRSGDGVPQSYDKALRWYRKAADAGNPEGMDRIGYLYETGKGVPEDDQQAFAWFQKAAVGGNTTGMVNLGYLYDRGKGVAQDYAQAMTWYRKAADAHEATAMNNVGAMYEDGRGVAIDYAEALKWFHKAADGGDALAMRNLGGMYAAGDGIAPDRSQAIQWFQAAVKAGDTQAAEELKALGVTPEKPTK